MLFQVLQPIKLLLNIHKIIRGYYRYAERVCEAEMLRATVRIFHIFMKISDNCWLIVPKIAKKGT